MGKKLSMALAAAMAAPVLAPALFAPAAQAQAYPVTGAQRATAQQVAQAGVPLADLAPGAPDRYTIKRGDTLWDLSGLYLRQPWRWPELWGMNLDQIRNPHLIYPGQVLVLERRDGRATLRVEAADTTTPPDTVRLSPRVRTTPAADLALPTLRPSAIEPFLAEPLVVDAGALASAPRIVAATDSRVLLTRGDRAYVRGPDGAPLVESPGNRTEYFRVFREARPLRDPVSGAILGYEAQYLGRATLARSEAAQAPTPVPATVDIVAARGEMRVGDRLLPEPGRQLVSYAPRPPEQTVQAAVVGMYGDAVGLAGQNQVVSLNKGTADGIASGHVLAILKTGGVISDRSEPGRRDAVQLPDERNGLLMVFRAYERVSYGLILETRDGVRVGDRLVNPR